MSHIVTCSVEFKNEAAFQRSVKMLLESGLIKQDLGQGTHKVYSREVTGHGILLEGWSFPVVKSAEGKLDYDNFSGSWGPQATLDRFTQRYSVEALKLEAELSGLNYTETVNENGSVDLEVMCA